MSGTNSTYGGGFFSGLVKMVLALIVLGVGAGVVASNLPKQLAEADQIRAETVWQARVRQQVELPNLEAERELQLRQNQALLEARQNEQLRLERLRHDQQLRTEAMVQHAMIFLLLLLFSSLAVVLTVTLTRLGWQLAGEARLRPMEPPSKADPWQDPQWRRLRREEASKREKLDRRLGQAVTWKHTNGAKAHP